VLLVRHRSEKASFRSASAGHEPIGREALVGGAVEWVRDGAKGWVL
jgi:hypothetical protein